MSHSAAGFSVPLLQAQWLLASFCAVHRVAFDPVLFSQRFLGDVDPEGLERASAELGLVARRRHTSLGSALAWTLPVAILVEPANRHSPVFVQGAAEGDGVVASAEWMLVLNADEEQALVLEACQSTPKSLDIVDLTRRYRGSALAFAPTAACSDPDDLEFQRARFGLRWFLPELLKHKPVWRDVLVASLVLQLIALAVPLFTQVIIDKVVVHRTESTLIALSIGMAIFIGFSAALTWIRQYLVLHTGQRIDAVLGSHVFDHLFRLPPRYFQQRPTGVISARLQGVETIREFIASSAVTLLLDVPFLVIFLAIMFWYSVTLTWIVLGILTVIGALSALAAPLFQQRLNEQFLRGAANQAFLTEYVAGVETVKSLQLEPQLNQRYRNLLAEYLKANIATRQLANSYNTWAGTLEQLMSVSILVVGAWIVMSGAAFTIGMLVAFQMFTQRISQPVLRMVGLWQQWQQTRLAVTRLGDVMNAPAETYSVAPRRANAPGAGKIDIEGLGFRYDTKLPLLFDHFNLSVAPGQLVALMGPSGAGKSTLARLLQGFCVPTEGRIRIDGIDHQHLTANELRANFGVVPQETLLFAGTILENLRLAHPFATFEQVVAACKMAEIHTAIESLPDGYETRIGERGSGLSGGQRQRLAIARALIKGPKILLFDEATSSVDATTSEQLARTINALKGRVTILFIAHHLPKSLSVDQVVRIGEKLSVVTAERAEGITP